MLAGQAVQLSDETFKQDKVNDKSRKYTSRALILKNEDIEVVGYPVKKFEPADVSKVR